MLRLALPCLVALLSGCTFYTACPTDNGNDKPNDTTSAMGGSSGSNGTGGSGTSGASGPIGEGGEAPMGEWVNVTSDLAGVDSECGNMSLVVAKPDEDFLIAGIALRGLYTSDDGGESWTHLEPEEEDIISNRATAIVFDPDDPDVVWESGIYGNHGGIYKSTDGARSFKKLGDTRHNEQVSIDFTDPDRKTMIAGGHEQLKTLYKSVDAGETWSEIGENLPDDVDVSSFPLVLDADNYLLGVGGYGDNKSGVLRTTDGGDTWELVAEDIAGWSVPLVHSDGTIYWPAPFHKGLGKSTDSGQTWEALPIGDALRSVMPIELPDGRIASATSEHVVVSDDGGETWKIVTSKAPIVPVGIAYSVQRKAFYIWYWDCGKVVPSDGIFRYDFDYETE